MSSMGESVFSQYVTASDTIRPSTESDPSDEVDGSCHNQRPANFSLRQFLLEKEFCHGQNGGDVSMAVNLSQTNGPDRDNDLDAELEMINTRESVGGEDEDLDLMRLAAERGTSAQAGEIQEEADLSGRDGKRFSSGTVVKMAPSLDLSYLPVLSPEKSVERDVVCEERQEVVVEEQELLVEEIVEEVIEYEYEIVG